MAVSMDIHCKGVTARAGNSNGSEWVTLSFSGPAHDLRITLYFEGHGDSTLFAERVNAPDDPPARAAIAEVDGCFEAALAEGWVDALANGDIERIRDLWNRRLSRARDLFPTPTVKATGATS